MAHPIRVYGSFGDFAALDAWYDVGLDIARNLIPQGTIVGNAIGSTRPKGGTVQPTQLTYPPPTSTTSPPTPAGGGMPSWVMPVAIGAGALILFMMIRPRGRR